MPENRRKTLEELAVLGQEQERSEMATGYFDELISELAYIKDNDLKGNQTARATIERVIGLIKISKIIDFVQPMIQQKSMDKH